MNFLCSKHRLWLSNQPLIAKKLWHRSMLSARDAVRAEDWQLAVKHYGSAFELANLLLDSDDFATQAQKRYAHTAVELAYTLAANHGDFSWLLRSVRQRLEYCLFCAPAADLLAMLFKLRQSPAPAQPPQQDPIQTPGQNVAWPNLASTRLTSLHSSQLH